MKSKAIFYSIIAGQIVFLCLMIASKYHLMNVGQKITLAVKPVDPHDLFRGEYVRLGYDISTISYGGDEAIHSGDIVYVTLKPGEKGWEMVKTSTEKPTTGEMFIKGLVTSARPIHELTLDDLSDEKTPGWIESHPDEIESIRKYDQVTGTDKPGEDVWILFYRYNDKGPWRHEFHKKEADAEKMFFNRTFYKEECALISARIVSVAKKNKLSVKYGIENFYVPEGKAPPIEEKSRKRKLTAEIYIDGNGNSTLGNVLIGGEKVVVE